MRINKNALNSTAKFKPTILNHKFIRRGGFMCFASCIIIY